MKLTFLGTGTSQGVPVICGTEEANFSTDPKDKRLRSSVFIEKDDVKIMIDCSPDFRFQCLRENIRNFDAILFTHQHADHTSGLDDIRPICHFNSKDMPIYAERTVIKALNKRFDYAFKEESERYPGAPSIKTNFIKPFKSFFIQNMEILPLRIMHGQLPILGFLIDKKLAYITDASFISEETLEQIKEVDTLILNSLRISQSHPTHFILPESLEIIAKVKPKRSYLTHINASMGLHEKTSLLLPENVFLAYDSLKLTI